MGIGHITSTAVPGRVKLARVGAVIDFLSGAALVGAAIVDRPRSDVASEGMFAVALVTAFAVGWGWYATRFVAVGIGLLLARLVVFILWSLQTFLSCLEDVASGRCAADAQPAYLTEYALLTASALMSGAVLWWTQRAKSG